MSILLPCPAAAQATWTPGWTVTAAPQVDLWYHAMATIGPPEITALPQYDRDYQRLVLDLKKSSRVFPTALDQHASELRKTFSESPVFEGLHLIPAYFPTTTPERMLAAIRLAAAGEDAGSALPDVALGIDMIGRRFTTRKERQALLELVDLVEREWDTFYREYWGEGHERRSALIFAVQAHVNRFLETRMAMKLAEWRVQSGTLFLSAPVGDDGRVFLGDPNNPSDNVIVVRAPLGTAAPERAAFALVREACVPTANTLVTDLHIGRSDRFAALETAGRDDRYTATQAAGRGAVRCGAWLLEQFAPELVQRYRNTFVGAEQVTADEFDAVFSIDARLAAALGAAIARR